MLLWCDGFDHYGVIGNLTQGAWAAVATGWSLSASNPRTGTHAMTINANTTSARIIRRVLGGAKTTVGIGAAYHFNALPSGNNLYTIMDFRDAANAIQISIVVQSTGTIAVKRDHEAGTQLGVSASPVIVTGAYQHVEVLVFFSQTVGTVEVRVNGVTVVSISGADTVASSLVECSQVSFPLGPNRSELSAPNVIGIIDDIFVYDGTGTENNTFIGDRRVLTLFPNENTAEADWTAVGAASGYEAIDDASPDGDTSYITAGVPGSPRPISEFGFQNLPAGVSAISGVVIVEMARKTDAGDANTQWAIVSGASESAGADKPMTEVYTYRQDVFELDPDTAAPFTSSSVDALLGKVERTL